MLAFCCTDLFGQAAKTPAVMTSYETVKLGVGIYAFIAPESNGAMVTGNSLVVIGDDGVLVVDSGHFPSLTARQIAQIQQWTDKPVRFLVNTHWHPDHNAGNGLYKKAYPGIQIVSTPATRSGMETVLPKKEVSEGVIQQFEGTVQTGTLPNGKPLEGDDRKYYEKVAAELTAFRPELKAADHALPTTTFKDAMTVYLGKREVQILFLGRGNTGGDALVYVPDSRLLATGDLLVYPVPYPFGSFIGEWIEVLKKIEAMDAAIIVPGHGPVMRDKNYLDLNIKLLQATKEQTDTAVKQGLSLEVGSEISPPCERTYFSSASAAPFRISRPSRFTPDIRVCAEKGTNSAGWVERSLPRSPYFVFASTTMERPSGVSSGRDANCAASASWSALTPGAGMNSEAWRLPSVIVPVLSRSRVFTSPAASTARPDIASTLCCTNLSMPAMPIAESKPPIVVGIKQTRSDTKTNIVCGEPE
jgi:glyoxylase-like metal-dependent hydrolase (beta-lactamase superfamily II)